MGTWRRKKGSLKPRLKFRNRLENIRIHKLIDWDAVSSVRKSMPLSEFMRDIK